MFPGNFVSLDIDSKDIKTNSILIMGVFVCGLFGWAVGWIIGLLLLVLPVFLIFLFWVLMMIVDLSSSSSRSKRKEQSRRWEEYKNSPQFQQRLTETATRYGSSEPYR